MTTQSFAIVLVRAIGLWLIVAGALSLLDTILLQAQFVRTASPTGWSTYPPTSAPSPPPSPVSAAETWSNSIYTVVAHATPGNFTHFAPRLFLGLAFILCSTPLGRLLAPRDSVSTSP